MDRVTANAQSDNHWYIYSHAGTQALTQQRQHICILVISSRRPNLSQSSAQCQITEYYSRKRTVYLVFFNDVNDCFVARKFEFK